MTTLQEVREKYPQYKDVPDQKLADALYAKFYEGKIERSDFDSRIGLASASITQEQADTQANDVRARMMRAQAQGLPTRRFQSEDEALAGPLTTKKVVDETLGIEELKTRGAIAPVGQTKDGEKVWAVPQAVLDLLQGAAAPGVAARGGDVNPHDIANLTLGVAGGGGVSKLTAKGRAKASNAHFVRMAEKRVAPVADDAAANLVPRTALATADDAIPPATLEDFATAGVPPDLASVSGGATSRFVKGAEANIPGAADVIKSGTDKQIAAAKGARDEIAGEFGSGFNEESVGGVVEKGIERFAKDSAEKVGKPTNKGATASQSSLRAKQELLYDSVGAKVPKGRVIKVENTEQVLRSLMDRFDEAALNKLFTNRTFRRFAETFAPRDKNVTIPAHQLPGGKRVERVWPSNFGTSKRPKFVENPPIDVPPQTVVRPLESPKLSYDDMRGFRSNVRILMRDPDLAQTMHQADWSRLMQAMTEDMVTGVRNAAGDNVARELRKADKFTRTAMNRINDVLDDFYDTNNAGQVFSKMKAAAKRGASTQDTSKLRAIKRTLRPEEWNEVASTFIRSLGRQTSGAADDAGFSLNTFVKDWADLSPQARGVLFSSPGMKEQAKRLDALARVVSSLKKSMGEVSMSKSGNPRELLIVGGAFTQAPLMTVAALLANRGVANVVMSPTATKWLTQAGRIAQKAPRGVGSAVKPNRAWTRHMARLEALAANDNGAREIFRALSTAAEDQDQQ